MPEAQPAPPGRLVRVGGPQFYPLRSDSDIGGEVYERMLVERLPELGIALELGLPTDQRLGTPPPGVRVEILRHGRDLHWLGAPRVYVPYVVRLLRERRVDLLRGQSVRYSGPSLLLARALARAHTPVVLHHHHFFPRWRALEARILRRADGVITVSEHSRRDLIEAGVDERRIHVVLDGVSRPPRGPGCEELWAGGLRLLHVGRLEPRKRPAVAIDALAELRHRGVECSLVVAGDGDQRDFLVERARAAGVGDRVNFLGRVGEQRKWQLYDSAELLVFASALEGFGLVVAEAQSRGLPVVAARGTATAEALEEGATGVLTEPTARAFAGAVSELVDPSRRASMAARAVEFARRFDWDTCAAGVADVYRSLV